MYVRILLQMLYKASFSVLFCSEKVIDTHLTTSLSTEERKTAEATVSGTMCLYKSNNNVPSAQFNFDYISADQCATVTRVMVIQMQRITNERETKIGLRLQLLEIYVISRTENPTCAYHKV